MINFVDLIIFTGIIVGGGLLLAICFELFFNPVYADKLKLRYYLMYPDKITLPVLRKQANGEDAVKLYNLVGHERFIQTVAFYDRPIVPFLERKDNVGSLYIYRINMNHPWVHVVKVKNSTPEPDGTYKDYYIRVPDDTYTPRQGIAWTFGLSGCEYNPEIET